MDASTQRVDDRLDRLGVESPIHPGLLHVEDLATHRQDRLDAWITPLGGRTTGGVTLHDEDLTLLGIGRGAVLEFARQRRRSEQALAVAGHVASLACRNTGLGSRLGLGDDELALLGVLLEPVRELLVEHLLHEGSRLGVAQLGLRLTLELWLGEFDGDDRRESLTDVVTGDAILAFLDHAPALTPPVDDTGECGAEALLVGTTLDGVDGVGEGVHAGGVRRVPLHRDLQPHPLLGTVCLQTDDRGVDDVLGPDEERDVVLQSIYIMEFVMQGRTVLVDVSVAQITQADAQTLVEEGHLAEPGRQGFVVEDGGVEDVGRGFEGDRRTGGLGLLQLFQGPIGHTKGEGLTPVIAIAEHLNDECARQGINDRGTHTVQATGHLVAAVTELATGVQHGEHQGDGGDVFDGVLLDRDTTAVVTHSAASVVQQFDLDGVAVARQGLVDGVVDDLVDQVVQAALTGGSDVHAGTLANRLETFQHRDLPGIVGAVDQ